MGLKRALFFLCIAGILFVGLVLFWTATLKIPDFNSFNERKIIQSTKIYDRTGEILLWDIHENIQRTVVPYDQISRHAKNATVAIEDSNFYKHLGVEPLSILRATLKNIASGSLSQGGSTITQQLIKNTYLTKEKTFTRKIKELILSLKLEQTKTKDEILELYLNEIPYGGSSYGIEAASRNFFGKSANDLSLAESAYLAALPQAPTYYSPYGNHRKELEARKNIVLDRMVDLGFIMEEESQKAKEEKVNFIIKGNQSIKAPHFSIYVREYLESKYGYDLVEEGGLKVISTLDLNLQAKAEDLLALEVADKSQKFHATNAGLVAIDPKTGQVLTMVGSKDYFNQKDEGNFNVTLAKRQPGSSIKPFVYATAFEKGYTPNTVVFDLKTEFSTSCNSDGSAPGGVDPSSCYSPENYDGIYRGPISLRDALAQSINIPAVKVLYLSGMEESAQTMRKMGLSTITDYRRYGLTLVLGGGEVTLLELTGGYAAFANEGLLNKPVVVLRVEDSSQNILEEYTPRPEQAINKNSALLISDVLSDNKARTPAFGANSFLHFPNNPVAVKTGTTNDYRDAWVVGYSPDIAIGVWFGNNDNSPMEKKVAGFIAAPLWHAVMEEALKTYNSGNGFQLPLPQNEPKPVLRGEWRGGNVYLIDSLTGKRATSNTPQELIKEKVLTSVHSILYWLDKDNPLGPKPLAPDNDPQFRLWEYPVRNWAQRNGYFDEDSSFIPKEIDNIHHPINFPKVKIISPLENRVYKKNEAIHINISAQTVFGISQIDYFANDIYIGSSKKEPFIFSFIPENINQGSGVLEIRVVVYDNVKNKGESSVSTQITE